MADELVLRFLHVHLPILYPTLCPTYTPSVDLDCSPPPAPPVSPLPAFKEAFNSPCGKVPLAPLPRHWCPCCPCGHHLPLPVPHSHGVVPCLGLCHCHIHLLPGGGYISSTAGNQAPGNTNTIRFETSGSRFCARRAGMPKDNWSQWRMAPISVLAALSWRLVHRAFGWPHRVSGPSPLCGYCQSRTVQN